MLWYGHGSSLFILFVLAAFVLRAVAARRNGARRRGPNGGGPYGGGPGGRYGRYGGPFGGSGTGPGGTRPPATGQTGTDQMAPGTAGTGSTVGTAGAADPSGQTGIPAGWMVDPSGKHQQRYWSGTVWTEHVADDGVPGLEPLPGASPATEGPASGEAGTTDGSTGPGSPAG